MGMPKLSIREARKALAHLADLNRTLAREGEVTITRYGRPIARIVATSPRLPVPSHGDLRASMRKMRDPSEKLVRQDRDER